MAEVKEYIAQPQEEGAVYISQDVIATIAAVAANEVEGVYALTSQTGDGAERYNKKSAAKGIRLCLADNDEISIECSFIAVYGYSVVELAKNVQEGILSAIESMTAMKVAAVDVNVVGISMKK